MVFVMEFNLYNGDLVGFRSGITVGFRSGIICQLSPHLMAETLRSMVRLQLKPINRGMDQSIIIYQLNPMVNLL
jgi:hypothetical protein